MAEAGVNYFPTRAARETSNDRAMRKLKADSVPAVVVISFYKTKDELGNDTMISEYGVQPGKVQQLLKLWGIE